MLRVDHELVADFRDALTTVAAVLIAGNWYVLPTAHFLRTIMTLGRGGGWPALGAGWTLPLPLIR